jgi:hypothetical protein
MSNPWEDFETGPWEDFTASASDEEQDYIDQPFESKGTWRGVAERAMDVTLPARMPLGWAASNISKAAWEIVGEHEFAKEAADIAGKIGEPVSEEGRELLKPFEPGFQDISRLADQLTGSVDKLSGVNTDPDQPLFSGKLIDTSPWIKTLAKFGMEAAMFKKGGQVAQAIKGEVSGGIRGAKDYIRSMDEGLKLDKEVVPEEMRVPERPGTEVPKVDEWKVVDEKPIEAESPELGKGVEPLSTTSGKIGKQTETPVNTEGTPSSIAKSIEAKAIESGFIADGFDQLAGFDSTSMKAQAKGAADLLNGGIDNARNVIRGTEPLPEGLRGISVIKAMEEHIKTVQDPAMKAELAYELANSRFSSEVSEAGQLLSVTRGREADSFSMRIAEVKKARESQAGKDISKKTEISKKLKEETNKVNLPKEELSWDRFLKSIEC